MATAQELERIAMLYIDGLLSADDSKVPLSPTIKRAHLMILSAGPHVWQMTEGAETVRRNIRGEKLTARENMRVLDGGHPLGIGDGQGRCPRRHDHGPVLDRRGADQRAGNHFDTARPAIR
jgi:hypothetical protein